MLSWANRFSICCFMDSNGYESPHQQYDLLLAVKAKYELRANAGNALKALRDFVAAHRDWVFGHLGFDLKNELDGRVSIHTDHIGFPDLYFFVPEILIQLSGTEIRISSIGTSTPAAIFAEISGLDSPAAPVQPVINFEARFSKAEYLATIRSLKDHIVRGDCYEINFCQEFFSTGAGIDPVDTFRKLLSISPNPFAAFYKLEDCYLLCASPERYIKLTGSHIISQPIKGTLKREIGPAEEAQKIQLYLSEKDRAENVMVVDMVRSDLSRVCKPGSVKVDELYGVYTFPQVYQMISTISGELKEQAGWIDAVAATFPMGSMTGAPKPSVLELIEQYERSKRGIFSGAIGYADPDGNADFNVVIRSIMYNASSRYLSYQVGSGITHYSDPESEYAECLLKAAAIKKVLGDRAP